MERPPRRLDLLLEPPLPEVLVAQADHLPAEALAVHPQVGVLADHLPEVLAAQADLVDLVVQAAPEEPAAGGVPGSSLVGRSAPFASNTPPTSTTKTSISSTATSQNERA